MWADASADGPRRKQARRAQGSDENTTNGCEPGATDERSPAHALPLRERQSNAERAGSGPGDAGVGGGAGGAEQGGCVSGKPRRWTGRRGTAYRCSRCRQPKRGHSCAAEGGADDPGGVPGVGMEAGRALSDKELMLAELAFGGEPPKARAAQQPPPPVGRPPPVLTPDEATARGAIGARPARAALRPKHRGVHGPESASERAPRCSPSRASVIAIPRTRRFASPRSVHAALRPSRQPALLRAPPQARAHAERPRLLAVPLHALPPHRAPRALAARAAWRGRPARGLRRRPARHPLWCARACTVRCDPGLQGHGARHQHRALYACARASAARRSRSRPLRARLAQPARLPRLRRVHHPHTGLPSDAIGAR